MVDPVDIFLGSKLLFSQDKFIFAPEKHLIGLGAYGSGKTRSLVHRSLFLSVTVPNNEGLIGRAFATELETTTEAQFFEYCHPNLIDNFHKKQKRVTIRTIGAKVSTIWFRHIIEPNPTKQHLTGLNLGWFALDQIEDCARRHWDNLHGRLRRENVKRHYGFGVANPKGHDWIYKMMLKPAIDRRRVKTHIVPGVNRPAKVMLYRATNDHLCVKTETEENVLMMDDPYLVREYIRNLREHNSPEWVARYVDGSTDEWSGRIYKEFNAQSVHVITPFKIPDEWPCIVTMDAGGDAPWAILVLRQDPQSGDVFVTNEFYEATTLLSKIAAWIKNRDYSGIPHWQDAEYICDPENKQVIFEFQDVHRLNVFPAQKGPKLPGIHRVSGYMHRIPGRIKRIPDQLAKHPLADAGDILIADAPYLWVFNRCTNTITEHEEWCWDYDQRTNESKNRPVDKNDHTCDALLYGLRNLPPIEEVIKNDPQMEAMKKSDYFSYKEVLRVAQEKSWAADIDSSNIRGVGEAYLTEVGSDDEVYRRSERESIEY